MAAVGERLKNAWNAFLGRSPTQYEYKGYSSTVNPSRPRLRNGSAKSIISSVYNWIAVDCSSINFNHVRVGDDGKFTDIIDSSLNRVLSKEANIDQTGRALIRDIVISMLDEGCIAVVPFETDIDPKDTDSFKVLKARTARILEWFPKHIRVEIYNEDSGQKVQMLLEKRICAIIENPFYAIMNETNSTAQRLIRILNQIDRTNEQNSSGKLDMIIQLPYVIRGDARTKQAETRRQAIVDQLTSSQYGIAYIDGTEKIVQLNRSLENNLWEQAKDLTTDLFSQLGLSKEIFNGTASDVVLLNYYNRTIEPIVSAIVEAMERSWLSRTAQSQGQAIRFFRDPFKLVPVSQIAEIADKFTRNEIMSSNEIRAVIGMKPSNDPKADQLINANLNQASDKQEEVKEVIDVEKNNA
jgi:hypothetical protein